jgi:hypothetical protein
VHLIRAGRRDAFAHPHSGFAAARCAAAFAHAFRLRPNDGPRAARPTVFSGTPHRSRHERQ